jgi:hypothetical protein
MLCLFSCLSATAQSIALDLLVPVRDARRSFVKTLLD